MSASPVFLGGDYEAVDIADTKVHEVTILVKAFLAGEPSEEKCHTLLDDLSAVLKERSVRDLTAENNKLLGLQGTDKPFEKAHREVLRYFTSLADSQEIDANDQLIGYGHLFLNALVAIKRNVGAQGSGAFNIKCVPPGPEGSGVTLHLGSLKRVYEASKQLHQELTGEQSVIAQIQEQLREKCQELEKEPDWADEEEMQRYQMRSRRLTQAKVMEQLLQAFPTALAEEERALQEMERYFRGESTAMKQAYDLSLTIGKQLQGLDVKKGLSAFMSLFSEESHATHEQGEGSTRSSPAEDLAPDDVP